MFRSLILVRQVFRVVKIKVREYRKGNRKLPIQRNWQHWVQKTQEEDKQNKNTTLTFVR